MTRKTRMIFVEEVLDTEKENSVYKSFEMQSKVTKKQEQTSSDASGHSSSVSSDQNQGESQGNTQDGHGYDQSNSRKCGYDQDQNSKGTNDQRKNSKSQGKAQMQKQKCENEKANGQNGSTRDDYKKNNVQQPPMVDEECFEDHWDFVHGSDPWIRMSPTTAKLKSFPASPDPESDILETKDILIADTLKPENASLSVSNNNNQSGIMIGVNNLPNMFKVVHDQSIIKNQHAEESVEEKNPITVPRDSLPTRRSNKKSLSSMVRGIPSFSKLRNIHHLDDLKTMEDSLLYQKLKNLFLCMKITGIFFVRKQRTSVGARTRFIRNCTFQQTYCTTILVVLIVNFLRSLTAFSDANFNELGSVLFFKFLTSIFFYESMSRAYLAYMAAYR